MLNSRQENNINKRAVDTHFIWICHLI